MTHETQELLEFMTRPGARLVADMKKLDGDIMILGAGNIINLGAMIVDGTKK